MKKFIFFSAFLFFGLFANATIVVVINADECRTGYDCVNRRQVPNPEDPGIEKWVIDCEGSGIQYCGLVPQIFNDHFSNLNTPVNVNSIDFNAIFFKVAQNIQAGQSSGTINISNLITAVFTLLPDGNYQIIFNGI